MQRGYIKLREVLQWLWNPANRNIAFQISFCSLDIKRDTGGEIIELASAIRPTKDAIADHLGKSDRPPLKSIDQNRLENATFNVYVKERNRFYAVHNDLILLFNHQRVVY